MKSKSQLMKVGVLLASVSCIALAEAAHKPDWCSAKWSGNDRPYLAARKEAEEYGKWTGFQWKAPVTEKAIAAIKAFQKKRDDPVLLYRATALYVQAHVVDPGFEPDALSGPLCGTLHRGWREIKAKPGYEFSRLGYIFAGYYMGVEGLDDLGLALLRRNPDDAQVMVAYICAGVSRVDNSSACGERCVRFGDRLVKLDPKAPLYWYTRAKAYWVRSCTNRATMKGDLATTADCIERFRAMTPTNHPIRKSLSAWLKTIADTQKGL
jgi:hypothetical protein